MKVTATITKKRAATTKGTPTPKPPARAARLLALANLIGRSIESGQLQDYATAARQLGIMRSRVTQVVNLLNLPAEVQEGLLVGTLEVSERELRGMASEPVWGQGCAGDAASRR